MSIDVATSNVIMRKKIIISVIVLLIGVGAFILYKLNNWGEASREFNGLTIISDSNDITELNGNYMTYDLDSSRSELMFTLDAMQGTIGKFKKFEVTFVGNDQPKIIVVIDPSSVHTGERTRDRHLLGEGFFKVNSFPIIRFESSSIELVDSNYVVNGTLNMLGLEKELSIPFSYKGKSENYKGLEVAIFEGKFTIDRTNFGMEHTKSVGDQVSVDFKVQLEKQHE